MSAIRVERLLAAPDGGPDVVGLCGTRGRSSGAVDRIRRFETSCERYFGELRARLEEVQAMLALAEDELGRDQRVRPVRPDAAGLIDASVDAAASVDSELIPTERSVGQQPEAVLRLIREEWRVAVRKSQALEERASGEVRPVLEVLGRERGVVRLREHSISLSRRHTEILVLLVRHPSGLTTEQLALAVYGDAAGRGRFVRRCVVYAKCWGRGSVAAAVRSGWTPRLTFWWWRGSCAMGGCGRQRSIIRQRCCRVRRLRGWWRLGRRWTSGYARQS